MPRRSCRRGGGGSGRSPAGPAARWRGCLAGANAATRTKNTYLRAPNTSRSNAAAGTRRRSLPSPTQSSSPPPHPQRRRSLPRARRRLLRPPRRPQPHHQPARRPGPRRVGSTLPRVVARLRPAERSAGVTNIEALPGQGLDHREQPFRLMPSLRNTSLTLRATASSVSNCLIRRRAAVSSSC
jgi:hypothetical protein